MDKLKILVVLTGGLFRDGITLSQLDYMKRINKEQFSIDIASVLETNEEINEEFRNTGCNVIILPNRQKHLFQYIIELNKTIKKNKYDIIHVHGSSSLMAIELFIAKINRIPVRIAHSRNTKSNHQKIEKVLRPIFNSSYNVAFACGEDAGKWLFVNRKFTIFHNGKDLSKFKFDNEIREKIRNNYNLNSKTAIGNVGNFNEQKNHEFLIRVFNDYHKKNKDSVLFLIGMGHKNENAVKYEQIKALVNELELGDSVYFTGSINNVEELLQAMDIMLLPSLFEGLPNVVLEWQAAGLPCIISDTVTTECKVYNDVVFLPINEGTSQWIQCIDSLLDEKIDRYEMSKLGCEQLIKNGFEIDSNTYRLEQIYIDLFNMLKRENNNEKNKNRVNKN